MNKQKGLSTLWRIIILLVIGVGDYYFTNKNTESIPINENNNPLEDTNNTTKTSLQNLQNENNYKLVPKESQKIIESYDDD